MIRLDSKNNRLHSYFPTYLAILLTPLGFIPLVGYLVVNAVVLLIITLILLKQDRLKSFIKVTSVSYGVAMLSMLIGLFICFMPELKPPSYYSLDNIYERTLDSSEIDDLASCMKFIGVGFIVSVLLLLAGHFFLTFGKKLFKQYGYKLWQRFAFALILTLLNAPYLFFISNSALINLGYNDFYESKRPNFESSQIHVEQSDINNTYTNSKLYLQPNLAQVKDKLYFNPSVDSEYGDFTYEISDSITSILERTSLISVYNDKLTNLFPDPILYYDCESKKFVPCDSLNIPEGFVSIHSEATNDTIYFLSMEGVFRYRNSEFKQLIKVNNDDELIIVLNPHFIDENDYYYLGEGRGWQSIFYHYNYEDKTTEELPVDMIDIDCFAEYDNCIYFISEFTENPTLFKADFNNKVVTELYKANGDLNFSMLGDTLCVSNHNAGDQTGVYISEKGSEFKKLSEANANEVYILDEKYIYYSTDSGNLYRITIDGQITEKVF